MIRTMKPFAILLATSLLSAAAFGNGTGTVTKIAVARSGYQVLLKLDGSVDPVGCRTRNDYDYYLDLNTTGAKEIFASLLAAKSSGQVVLVQSTGTCDAPGNGLEVIGYVVVQ